MDVSFFGDLVQSIADRGRALVGYGRVINGGREDILRLSEALLSVRGEASGVALARDILTGYASLPPGDRAAFLRKLAEQFGPDLGDLKKAAESFLADPGLATSGKLLAASEPRRQELIRRLNLAPGGTHALVRMREELIDLSATNPELEVVDRDFVHLFSSWFNRGFLVLRRIDWATPATVLEKIIRYEAVHEISDWEELRRRLIPSDRRLYAFFHPALNDEPLIFVQVALTKTIPDAIAPVLTSSRTPLIAAEARTAVFYSISNAQKGLTGISFGNFLLKQVVEELKRELPGLQTFVTLSPAPAFATWLSRQSADEASPLLTPDDRRAIALLNKPEWYKKSAAADAITRTLLPLAAHYFTREKTISGRPLDPVARFHLGNGACLERINPLADLSSKGLAQSFGLMVNYLYDLDHIEANHEAFADKGEIVVSSAIRKLAKQRSGTRDIVPSSS